MDDLAAQYDFVETEVIGQSWEYRDLKIIKICKGGCGNKPAIWLDGGMKSKTETGSFNKDSADVFPEYRYSCQRVDFTSCHDLCYQ